MSEFSWLNPSGKHPPGTPRRKSENRINMNPTELRSEIGGGWNYTETTVQCNIHGSSDRSLCISYIPTVYMPPACSGQHQPDHSTCCQQKLNNIHKENIYDDWKEK